MLCHSSYMSFIPMSFIAFRNVRLRMRRLFHVWISIEYYQLLSIILIYFLKNTRPFFLTFQRLLYISLQSRVCPPILKKFFYFLRWTFGKAPYSFQNKFCPPHFSKIFAVSGGHLLHSRICFSSAFVHRILKIFLIAKRHSPCYYSRGIEFCPPLRQINFVDAFRL